MKRQNEPDGQKILCKGNDEIVRKAMHLLNPARSGRRARWGSVLILFMYPAFHAGLFKLNPYRDCAWLSIQNGIEHE